MSNPKDDDIVARSDDQPETLIDDQLKDVDGGLGYKLTNAHITSFDVSGTNFDTIYAGSMADTIYAGRGDDVFGAPELFGGKTFRR